MIDIRFQSTLEAVNTWRILRLPPETSQRLPSRGMVMAAGTLNRVAFVAPLEPDGQGGHWLRVTEALAAQAALDAGSSADITLHLAKDWPEPETPADLTEALTAHGLLARWHGITVRARWEWVRWVRSTASPETRQRRVQVACSKLQAGKNRPCCFDMSSCTEPAVCRGGILIPPAGGASGHEA